MKRILHLLICVISVLVCTILPATAAEAEYDPFSTGRVTFVVEAPKGFQKIVYACLMDSTGAIQQFPVLPESDYKLVENVICGPYQVSGYVADDPFLEYIVLGNKKDVMISTEKDQVLKLTVSGGSEEAGESPNADSGSEEIQEPVSSDSEEPAVEDNPEEPEADSVSAEPTPDLSSEDDFDDTEAGDFDEDSETVEEPTERPFWQRFLGSVVSSVIFMGIVFGLVYLFRKFN